MFPSVGKYPTVCIPVICILATSFIGDSRQREDLTGGRWLDSPPPFPELPEVVLTATAIIIVRVGPITILVSFKSIHPDHLAITERTFRLYPSLIAALRTPDELVTLLGPWDMLFPHSTHSNCHLMACGSHLVIAS